MIQSYDAETETLLLAEITGFDQTDAAILEEISNFNWLWPIFEAKALMLTGHPQACRETWKEISQKLTAAASFGGEPVTTAWQHFRNRYLNSGSGQAQLSSLCSNNQGYERATILNSLESNDALCSLGLILIVSRLRNNLFHGTKGTLGFSDQLDNFIHANAVLRVAVRAL